MGEQLLVTSVRCWQQDFVTCPPMVPPVASVQVCPLRKPHGEVHELIFALAIFSFPRQASQRAPAPSMGHLGVRGTGLAASVYQGQVRHGLVRQPQPSQLCCPAGAQLQVKAPQSSWAHTQTPNTNPTDTVLRREAESSRHSQGKSSGQLRVCHRPVLLWWQELPLCCHLLSPSPWFDLRVCLLGWVTASPSSAPILAPLPLAHGEPRELMASPVPAPCLSHLLLCALLCLTRAFLSPPFPHPSAFGFSSLTDKAEILIILPPSITLKLSLSPGSLSFLRGSLFLVQCLQQKVSFYSFKLLPFPVLSPSVSHTHHSPQPINSHIRETASTSGTEKTIFEGSAATAAEPHGAPSLHTELCSRQPCSWWAPPLDPCPSPILQWCSGDGSSLLGNTIKSWSCK